MKRKATPQFRLRIGDKLQYLAFNQPDALSKIEEMVDRLYKRAGRRPAPILPIRRPKRRTRKPA